MGGGEKIKNYGEFAECFLLIKEIEKEYNQQEVRQINNLPNDFGLYAVALAESFKLPRMFMCHCVKARVIGCNFFNIFLKRWKR